MLPLLTTCWVISPKEKGRFHLACSAVWRHGSSLSPVSISCMSLGSSAVPLEPAVVMTKTSRSGSSWAQTGVLGRHSDFTWGHGTSTGNSWHLTGQQHVADLSEGGRSWWRQSPPSPECETTVSPELGGFPDAPEGPYSMVFLSLWPTAFPGGACGSAASSRSPHGLLPQWGMLDNQPGAGWS